MENRIFSIFKVHDYKGGELSSEINISFNSVVGTIVESGNLKHSDIECWEDLYEMEDEQLEKVCSEIRFKDPLYAGVDGGTPIEIYEHNGNRLVSIDESEFIPHILEYIRKTNKRDLEHNIDELERKLLVKESEISDLKIKLRNERRKNSKFNLVVTGATEQHTKLSDSIESLIECMRTQ